MAPSLAGVAAPLLFLFLGAGAWPAPGLSAGNAPEAAASGIGKAPEAHDGEIPEPEGYRNDDYRSPVPKTLAGARVIAADEAEALWRGKSAVFVDVFPRPPKPPNLPAGTVWRDPVHMSIEDANWLPNVGYGVLSPEFEDYFKTRLSRLTNGDKARPVVFYCLKDCWMSWNAGKRALSWGYTAVLWFSEGTDAWQEAGHDLVRIEPAP